MFFEVSKVFCFVGLLKYLDTFLKIDKACRIGVLSECLLFGIFPNIICDQWGMCVLFYVFKEHADFCHIPEAESIHTLNEFAIQSVFPQ